MLKWIAAYLAAGVVFIAADLTWITLTGPVLYQPVIGQLTSGTVDLKAGVAFYLIYLVGVMAFGVSAGLRARVWTRALGSGALFGLVAYATYDLTNQATLKVWSTQLTLMDMAWGAVATGLASSVGYAVASHLSKAVAGSAQPS